MGNYKFNKISDDFRSNFSYDYNLLFILDGKANFIIDNISFEINNSQILCFNYRINIRLEFGKNISAFIISFNLDFLDNDIYLKQLLLDSNFFGLLFYRIYSFTFTRITRIHQLLNIFKDEFEEDPSKVELNKSYLKLFLIKLRLNSELISNSFLNIYDKDYEIYLIFRDLLEKNYVKNYTASSYSNLMKISVRKLNSVVNKFTQKSPCVTITEKTINEAKWRLLHTNLNIQEVAYQLGFEDPLYFSRFFKKHTDLAPEQFRTKLVELSI